MAAAERFEGFADASASFFKRLAKHQTKAWFDKHKKEYEDGWQRPMHALLGEVRTALDKAYPHAELGDPHVMRIYRDVRFSKEFKFKERHTVQLRMDTFNTLNHVTFWPGDQYINTSYFGQVGGTFFPAAA